MALTYQQAVEQTITGAEQFHEIINGSATSEVVVEDGSKIPTVRKALLDNFYYKDPINWQQGQNELIFNQIRKFTDGTWWIAPTATATNPVVMGVTPYGDPLWKVFSWDRVIDSQKANRKLIERSWAEAGYNVVAGSFQEGATLNTTTDVIINYGSDFGVYSWGGTLPKVVPANSTVAGTGGLSPTTWVDKTNDTLRDSILKGPITEVFLVPTDFIDLQTGVDWILKNRIPTNNYIAALTIESGFEPQTGISVNNKGANYVYIRSQDSIVYLSNAFPINLEFIKCENGSAPTLDCLIDARGKCSIGYLVQNNAYGKINPNCGVKNVYGTGLAARYGAVCHANNTIWTGAAQGGGQTSGILSWAADISAEQADVSNSLHYGAQSAHGGYLSFRIGRANNCSRYGIRATDNGSIDADGAQTNDCGLNGVRAFNLGIINFRDGQAQRCGDNSDAASAAISASYGSIVNAVSSNLSLSKYQAVISLNSTVTVTQADMSGAYRFGINAQGASNISAGSSNVSGAGASGVQSIGSVVHCPNINADNCAAYAISALDSSSVNASGAMARFCGTGGITSRDGSVVNAKGSDTSGNLAGNCLFAWSGKIIATNAIAQRGVSPASTDIRVFEGGEIVANSSTIGGLSQTANTTTSNGIIFK